MTMELRTLRYFAEVVEQGSLGKAALRLGISQPALTKSLHVLELELDVKLLLRSSTGVTATAFGKSIYAHAKAVGAEVEHARAEIGRLRGQDQGFVLVGALPSIAGGILARAAALAGTRPPALAVRIVEKHNFELLPALRRGEFDFVVGLADHESVELGLRRRIILRDQLSIIARAGHPLERAAEVTARELSAYPWVFPMVGSSHRPILEQLFRAAGVEPPLAKIECTSVQLAKTVIQQSDHIGVLPAHVMQHELGAGLLIRLPVCSETLARTIAIFYRDRHPLSSGARALMRAVEFTCHRLNGPQAGGSRAGRAGELPARRR